MASRQLDKGLTLLEVIVVMAVLAILSGLILPAANSARSSARSLACRMNLRQLVLANTGYASENAGFFCPAAEDILDSAGLHRWHGTRNSLDEPFDPSRGPLRPYLTDGRINRCPQAPVFLQGQAWQYNFEQGCGGYGYNLAYIGSRLWDGSGLHHNQMKDLYRKTTNLSEVRRPAMTVMFTDTAMSRDGVNLIEYSFAEPPFAVMAGRVIDAWLMSPSIHFRHQHLANVGWLDGHVDPRPMYPINCTNAYGVESARLGLGWFEPIDNSMFDLQ